MRPSKLFTLILAGAIGLLVAGPQSVASARPEHGDGFTLAVYGDSPYGLNNTDTSQVALTPQFIAAVNADPDVSGVLHVGDIHSGKSWGSSNESRPTKSICGSPTSAPAEPT
jgi:hypothetical protein